MKLKLNTTNLKKLSPKNAPYDVRDTELTGFLARVRPSGTISYLVQYRDKAGIQQTYHLGNHDKDGMNPTKARDDAEEIRLSAKRGSDPHRERKQGQKTEKDSRSNTLLAYLEGGYQYHLEQREERSARDAENAIRNHFSNLLDLPMAEISPSHVERWRRAMRKKGRSEETIKRVGAELDVLVNRAVTDTDNPLNQNPLAGLPPIKAKRRDNIKPRYLLPDESKRLREALRERDDYLKARAASGAEWKRQRGHDIPEAPPGYYFDHLEPMVLLSLNTGIRQGELFSLLWPDLEHDYFEMNLRGENTKSGDDRSIPLNKEAREVLELWRSQTQSNHLVFSNKGEPFTDVKTAWRGLLKRAKINNFRWHDLRHDFASQLVIKGVPLNTVRELMGHATLEMTLRYAHLSNSAKADAVALLEV